MDEEARKEIGKLHSAVCVLFELLDGIEEDVEAIATSGLVGHEPPIQKALAGLLTRIRATTASRLRV